MNGTLSQAESRAHLLDARSYLYVPGHRPDMAEKAVASGADAIVIDLEDGVPMPSRRDARSLIPKFLAVASRLAYRPIVGVRLSSASGRSIEQEIRISVDAGVAFLRIPKVENADQVKEVADLLDEVEASVSGRQEMTLVQLGIESAIAVVRGTQLAVSDRVVGFALGATDLASSLGLPLDGDMEGIDVARSWLVLASAAAGLAPPIDSVYRRIDDIDGLRRTTDRARKLGFFGRSAIHPGQIAPINETFTPDAAEIDWARQVTAAAQTTPGLGAIRLASAEMVDAAVIGRASRVLRLASRYGDGAREDELDV